MFSSHPPRNVNWEIQTGTHKRGLTNGGLSPKLSEKIGGKSILENRVFSGLVGAFPAPVGAFRGRLGPIPLHLTARGRAEIAPKGPFWPNWRLSGQAPVWISLSTVLKFRRFTIRGAQPSARLSEEICLSEGSAGVSQRALRGSLRGFCGPPRGCAGLRRVVRGSAGFSEVFRG